MAKTIKAKKCYYHVKFGSNAFKCVGWCGIKHHLKQKEKKEDEKKPEESTKFMEIDPDIDEVDIDNENRTLLPDPVEPDKEEMSMALVINSFFHCQYPLQRFLCPSPLRFGLSSGFFSSSFFSFCFR